MAIDLSEFMNSVRAINEIYLLTLIENGDERWRKLQEARALYPEINKIIEDYIETDPKTVVGFLIQIAGIDQKLVALIDPKQQLQQKIEAIVSTIQQLYKEREKQNV